MGQGTKAIIYAGNFSVTTSGAQTFTTANDSEGRAVYGQNVSGYNHMDVLFNVKTLTGTSPTTQPSVQERFSDAGFIETANWGATITGTGKYIMAYDGQTGQTGTTNIKYGYAMLGKGIDKQVVFTNGGTIGSISVDVYYIFYR